MQFIFLFFDVYSLIENIFSQKKKNKKIHYYSEKTQKNDYCFNIFFYFFLLKILVLQNKNN